ncbi:MAG TPA: TetR/AcrR family transcriptional regulator [Sphingobium sp.]
MTEVRKRRARDPQATREVILEAARTLLAKYGPEALSLSEVAHLAGVNRGTAYQHFETREKLIQATADWVADKLFQEVFGDAKTVEERQVEQVDVAGLSDRLADFAMRNPELCRIWLLQLLSSPEPEKDPFWREYQGSLERFAQTDHAKPGIDSEVLSIIMLAGAFLWPVWAQSHAKDQGEQETLRHRFARECLRISMHGTLQGEKYPAIAARLAEDDPKPGSTRAA